ncbi:MAG: DUF4349 domain-containing protein [Nocardioidaceae bacterium]|nr:DUF4349 domain-containing protein [Nocardioidaceae bacterium]
MTRRSATLVRRPRPTVAVLAAVLAVALTVGLGACSSGGGEDSGGSTDSADAMQPESGRIVDADSSGVAGAQRKGAGSSGLVPTLDDGALVGRDVIRTADLSVVVEDIDAARAAVSSLVDDLDGVVASETSSVSGHRGGDPAGTRTMHLSLQVPTDSFDAALAAVSDLGDVRTTNIALEDVTAQVADVDSRVESARTALDRIRALLGRANKLGTVIQLEGVLADRQADLEALQAQQRTLAGQTQFATVRLELQRPARPPAASKDDTLRGFTAGVREGWDGLRELVVGVSTVLGVALPFALIGAVVLVPLAVLRRRRAPETPVSPPAA